MFFERKRVKEPIDIDELGSGEKEIIALFMPLFERQIDDSLRLAHVTCAKDF
jgi:hypothetical protein